MPASGELIRSMNYVEDITTTLRRICISIPAMNVESASGWPTACGPQVMHLMTQSKIWKRKSGGAVVAAVKTIAVIGAGIMGGASRTPQPLAATAHFRDLLPGALRKAELKFVRISIKQLNWEKFPPRCRRRFRRLEYAGSVDEAARKPIW